jgi:hypothetical protein
MILLIFAFIIISLWLKSYEANLCDYDEELRIEKDDSLKPNDVLSEI